MSVLPAKADVIKSNVYLNYDRVPLKIKLELQFRIFYMTIRLECRIFVYRDYS